MPPDPLVIDPWSDVSERSKVRIYSPTFGGVSGLLPKTFSQSFSQEWLPPFGSILDSFNTGYQAALELLGKGDETIKSASLKEISTRLWAGGTVMGVNGITLLYVARESALKDVMQPVRRLMQMASPRSGLKASAETVGAATGGLIKMGATQVNAPEPVEVELGYISSMNAVVITSFDVQWSNLTDRNGISASALVTLQLSTRRVFLGDDEEVTFNEAEGGLTSFDTGLRAAQDRLGG